MDEVLKTTALVYLQQALISQKFEDCQELVNKAKKYGASPSEISSVITAFLQGSKPKAANEGKLGINRLKLLKESK